MARFATEAAIPTNWRVGDVILDRYVVREKITTGGMALVYRVQHRNWNVDLAVKSPRRELFKSEAGMASFVGESEAWVDLGLHPHIVSCYYVRILGGIPRVFAEYVEGGTLADWIRQRRLNTIGVGKPLRQILDVAIQMAWGLAFSHLRDVIHQDVKPSNIMMTNAGIAKVTDFGLAKAITMPPRNSRTAPRAGTAIPAYGLLTPAYCSPEQARAKAQLSGPILSAGHAGLSHKTDVWSWGLTVLSMFNGGTTWEAGQLARSILQNYLATGASAADVPPMPQPVVDLLYWCFENDAEARPSMTEVADRLLEIYQDLFGQRFPRTVPDAPELRAGSLNNRALSLHELGHDEQARDAWQEALDADPMHPEATYNSRLLRWRTGQITDLALLEACREVARSRSGDWLPAWLLSQVHLERGACQEATEVLEVLDKRSNNEPDVTDAYHEARERLPAAPRHLQTLAKVDPDEIQKLLPGVLPRILSSPDIPGVLERIKEAQDAGQDPENLARSLAPTLAPLLAPYAPFHLGPIWAVDLSADGTNALSAGKDTTLKLWEVHTGRYLRTFTGHSKDVRCARLSHDGRYAVSGSWDTTIRSWDISTGQCIHVFEGHAGEVLSVCFSHDGSHILSGGADETIRLWERETGKCVRILRGHTDKVNAICLGSDNRYALSGSDDRTLRLWDITTGACLRVLEGHEGPVNAVYLDSSLRALSGSNDKTVKLWDLSPASYPAARGSCIRTLIGNRDAVTSVVLAAGRELALTGSWDKTVKLWNLSTGRCLRTFEGHQGGVTSVCIAAGNSRGISAGFDGALKLWSLAPDYQYVAPLALARAVTSESATTAGQTFKQALQAAHDAIAAGDFGAAAGHLRRARSQPGYERNSEATDLWQGLYTHLRPARLRDAWCSDSFQADEGGTTSISLSGDARHVLSGGRDDYSAHLWELGSRKCVNVFSGHRDSILSVCLSEDGRYALTGSWDMTARLWNVESGTCLKVLTGHQRPITSTWLSANGRYALTGSWDATVRLWDTARGKCLRTLTHGEAVNSVCLDFRNRYVLAGGFGGTIRLWSLTDGRCIQVLRASDAMVHAVRLSAVGCRALSDAAETVIEWDLILGSRTQTFEGHTSIIFSMSQGLGDRFLLTGSRDKTIKIWDIASGACLRTLEGHGQEVTAVHLSPDGRRAASLGSDDRILSWELDWDLEDKAPADWDESVSGYLQAFLDAQSQRRRLGGRKQPTWDDEDFAALLHILGCAGYGWLRADSVRTRLKEMARDWKRHEHRALNGFSP